MLLVCLGMRWPFGAGVAMQTYLYTCCLHSFLRDTIVPIFTDARAVGMLHTESTR